MIPTISKILTGDKTRAAHYLGLAKKQMDILLRQMELSPYESVKVAERRLNLSEDGKAYILVISNYDLLTMHINIPFGAELKKEEWITYDCICVPHFSMAVVKDVTPDVGDVGYDDFLPDGRFVYDLAVCNGNSYILFENMYDANAGKYNINDIVIVGIFDEMSAWENPLDCARRCLIDTPLFSEICIYPINIVGKMLMWQPHKHTRVINDL